MATTLPAAPPPSLSQRPAPAPPAPTPPRRTGALIGGTLAALLAVALLVAGGLVLWVQDRKDAEGYLSTATHGFATRTAALTTESLDVPVGGPGWLSGPGEFGKVRLRAESRNGKRIFVGIARTADVRRYLRGTGHATVTDLGFAPFRSEIRTTPGGRPATEPWEKPIWVASTYGMGRRALTWKVREGHWSVVVMNADGSRGVDAGVSAGARLGFLPALGWSLLAGGVLLVLAAGGLLFLGTRRDGAVAPRAG